MSPDGLPHPETPDPYATLTQMMRVTHRLGLYDDCKECRRTGGHE